jgi:hypothetical protein
MAVKTTLKVIMTISLLCLVLIDPSFAAGNSDKPTQSPSSEKPKKEDNSKPTAAAATEVSPSTAARPVESKSAENKPTTEAKPSESKPTTEAKPSESKPTTEAKPSESKKSSVAGNTKEPKPDNSNKPDSKSSKKAESKSSKSSSGENGKGNAKGVNAKEEKTPGTEKNTKGINGGSAVPSPSPSQIESTSKPSSTATTSASETPSIEPSAEKFVRVEKSEGNKAVLVVSGPKIGSTIRITITSKGSSK